MDVAMETGQAAEIRTPSNLSTGVPQACSPGPTLTSRDGASPSMKAHPWRLGSRMPGVCPTPELPGPGAGGVSHPRASVSPF